MALQYPKLKGDDGKPFEIVIDKFGKGVMTLFDETRLPVDAVYTSQNMYQDQDGVYTTRPGTKEYGTALTTPIDGAGSYAVYNSDGTTDTYLWVVDNGSFKTSQDGGAWTTKTLNGGGAKTWTAGKPVYAKQIKNRLYISNGTEGLAYYDITNDYIVEFSALSAPGSLVAPTRSGLTTGAFQAYYKITAVNTMGESVASAEMSVSGGINKKRDEWTVGTDYLTMSWGSVVDAVRYNIYYSDTTGNEVYLDTVEGTTYVDSGTAAPNEYQEAPTEDTSAGSMWGYLDMSGNRLWATKDPEHPYRVGWSGAGSQLGSFDPFVGGGYIDLNDGGDEQPQVVKHFRDGRGNAVATALTSSPNGTGSTWHIALTSIEVNGLTINVPQAYQQQGSVGTRSPRGVVEYNNSIYYPSPKGFQSIGSKQNILNVLVTNEISGNIRPSVRGITNSAADKVAGYAINGRIYWSVPYGSSTNNEIWVLDIERGSTWTLPWSIGVKQFFEYTDSNGVIRFMGIPVDGTKLIEFDTNTNGDKGSAFSQNLLSGLVHWDENHMGFAYIQKVYVELSDPTGQINFTVSGTQKGKSFRSLRSVTISNSTTGSGVGADLFADFLLGDSNSTSATFTQASVKKYVRINKLLNNLRWQFTTSNIDSRFTLMQVVIKGVMLPTSDPASYRA